MVSAVTVSVNVVGESGAGVPVTVIMYDPARVAAVVAMVSVVEQVGLHDVGLNEAVAPEGRPEAEYETVWVVPEESVAVIVFEPEKPRVTAIPPELDKE